MHKAGKVLNRIRLVQMLPVPEPVRVMLMEKLMVCSDTGRKYSEARKLWDRNPRKTAGVNWEVSWEEYYAKWWGGQQLSEEKEAPKPVVRAQVVRRAHNHKAVAGETPACCPKCGSADIGTLHGGIRMRQTYRRYRYCKKCHFRYATTQNLSVK